MSLVKDPFNIISLKHFSGYVKHWWLELSYLNVLTLFNINKVACVQVALFESFVGKPLLMFLYVYKSLIYHLILKKKERKKEEERCCTVFWHGIKAFWRNNKKVRRGGSWQVSRNTRDAISSQVDLGPGLHRPHILQITKLQIRRSKYSLSQTP